MAEKNVRFDRLSLQERVVNLHGQMTDRFQRNIHDAFGKVEDLVTEVRQSRARTKIQLSYVSPQAILTAAPSTVDSTKAKITIPTHDRVYGDGVTVELDGATLDLLTYDTTYWVYYDDDARLGGTVTYVATTNKLTAAQTGLGANASRHTVGVVRTPLNSGSSPVTGYGPPPPGTSWGA